MEELKNVLEFINDNTGVTLLLSALGYSVNEVVKYGAAKDLRSYNRKDKNLTENTYKIEGELYSIISNFFISNNESEQFCIQEYERTRTFILDNDLFLREVLSDIGAEFADYIVEEVSNGKKDIKKQSKILKNYKKHFRS